VPPLAAPDTQQFGDSENAPFFELLRVFCNGFFTLRFVFSLGIDCQVVTVVRTNTCGADDHWQVEVSESATAREAGVFLVFLSPFLFTAVVPTLTNFGTHDLWIEF